VGSDSGGIAAFLDCEAQAGVIGRARALHWAMVVGAGLAIGWAIVI